MSNEVSKQQSSNEPIDGFEDYDENDRTGQSEPIIRFTNDALWVTREGEEIPSTREMVGINITREVIRWPRDKEARPERTVLKPGESFPDIAEMNEAVPKAEWVKGPDGQPRGPFQAQHVVHLLDPTTMQRYRYPTGTTGGHMAVSALRQQVHWMRKFRGECCYPVVVLSDVFMNTRFGGRQRPQLRPVRWITFGAPSALSSDTTPKLVPPSTAPAAKPSENQPEATQAELSKNQPEVQQVESIQPAQSGMQTVEEPSLKEEMGGDAVPW
jgi:hypothetical protein